MQRTKIFRCPGNDLIALVKAINPHELKFIMGNIEKEPGRNDFEFEGELVLGTDALYNEQFIDVTEYELNTFHKKVMKVHGERLVIINKLLDYDDKFGGDWGEIRYNLLQHVRKHTQCFNVYRDWVAEKADRLIRLNNEVGLHFKNMGKKTFEDLTLRVDIQHLQMGRELGLY